MRILISLLLAASCQAAIVTNYVTDTSMAPVRQSFKFVPQATRFNGVTNILDVPRGVVSDVSGAFSIRLYGGWYSVVVGTATYPIFVPLNDTGTYTLRQVADLAVNAAMFDGTNIVVSGGGLTNNPTLPGAVTATNLTAVGVFSGNGAGLTNTMLLNVANTNVLILSGFGAGFITIGLDPLNGVTNGPVIDATSANGTYYWSAAKGSYTNTGQYGVAYISGYSVLTNATIHDTANLADQAGLIVSAGGGAFDNFAFPNWFDGGDNTYPGATSSYPTIPTNLVTTSNNKTFWIGQSAPVSLSGTFNGGGTVSNSIWSVNATNAGAANWATNATFLKNAKLPDFATVGHDEPRWMIVLPIAAPYSYYNSLTSNIALFRSVAMTNRGTTMIHVDDFWQGSSVNGVITPSAISFPEGIRAAADVCHTNGLLLDMYFRSTDLATAGLTGIPYAYSSANISNMVFQTVDGNEIDTSFTYGDGPGILYGVLRDTARLRALSRTVNEGIAQAWVWRTNGTPRPYVVWGGLNRPDDWGEALATKQFFQVYEPETWDLFGMYELSWSQPGGATGDYLSSYAFTFKNWVAPYKRFFRRGHYLASDSVSDVELPFVGAGRGTDESWREWFALNAMVPGMVFIRSSDIAGSPARCASTYTNNEWFSYIWDRGYIGGDVVYSNNLTEVWSKPIGTTSSGTNLVTMINRNTVNSNVVLTAAMLNVSSNTLMQVRDPWFHTNGVTFSGGVSLSIGWSNVMAYAIYPALSLNPVTVGSSPFFWTNLNGTRSAVTLAGGTVTALGVNSNLLTGVSWSAASPGWNSIVFPGDVLCITNSGSPTLTWKAIP